MNNYRQLRQPISQIVSGNTLLWLLASSVSYYYGLTITKTPLYLIITTLIELLICLLSYSSLLFHPKKNDVKFWIYYFIVSVSSCYATIFAVYNTYFFIALQTNHYLDSYWYIGFASMIILFISNIIANIIMIKAKSMRTQNYRYIFRSIAFLVYAVYLIFYFILPHDIPNRFFFLGLIAITLGVQIATDYMFLIIGDYKYSIDHGEDPDE